MNNWNEVAEHRGNGKTVAMSIRKEIIVLQSTYSQFIYFIFGGIHYIYRLFLHKLFLFFWLSLQKFSCKLSAPKKFFINENTWLMFWRMIFVFFVFMKVIGCLEFGAQIYPNIYTTQIATIWKQWNLFGIIFGRPE